MTDIQKNGVRVTLLAGGVGGARMALGFYTALADVPGAQLDIIVNTGDDCDMWEILRICPDLDTVMYTLTGVVDPAQGWGVAGDTTAAMEMLRPYAAGQPDDDSWFKLGDRDIGTHIRRSQLLRSGRRLTDVTEQLSRALGLAPFCRILPMSDQDVRTRVRTVEYGTLDFQQYFVRRRADATVTGIDVVGQATATNAVIQSLRNADCIIFGPSNPFLSIDPILWLPLASDSASFSDIPTHIRNLIAAETNADQTKRRVAVSPIVGGKAIKGPAARLMADLGHDVSALGVARLYSDLVDLFVIDTQDAAYTEPISALGMRPLVTETVMRSDDDKTALARTILAALLTGGDV